MFDICISLFHLITTHYQWYLRWLLAVLLVNANHESVMILKEILMLQELLIDLVWEYNMNTVCICRSLMIPPVMQTNDFLRNLLNQLGLLLFCQCSSINTTSYLQICHFALNDPYRFSTLDEYNYWFKYRCKMKKK